MVNIGSRSEEVVTRPPRQVDGGLDLTFVRRPDLSSRRLNVHASTREGSDLNVPVQLESMYGKIQLGMPTGMHSVDIQGLGDTARGTHQLTLSRVRVYHI